MTNQQNLKISIDKYNKKREVVKKNMDELYYLALNIEYYTDLCNKNIPIIKNKKEEPKNEK